MYNYYTKRWGGMFVTIVLSIGMMFTTSAFWVRF